MLLFLNGQTFGVWVDNKLDLIFVSNDYYPNTPFIFSTSIDNHNTDTILTCSKKYVCWKRFIEYYQLGNLRFENVKIKNMCKQIIKSLLIV